MSSLDRGLPTSRAAAGGRVSGSHQLDGSQRSAIGIGIRANRPRRLPPAHQWRKTRLHSLLKESERDDLSKRPGRRRPCHYAQPRAICESPLQGHVVGCRVVQRGRTSGAP